VTPAIRVYAELTTLFLGFYTRRGDLNPPLSAATLHAALQGGLAIAILLQATWLGIWCVSFGHPYALSLSLGGPVFAANLIYLGSPSRRESLLSHVADPRCIFGKVAIASVAALLVVSLLLLKGRVPGVPARLGLCAVCPA
jgi:hypothetical protein